MSDGIFDGLRRAYWDAADGGFSYCRGKFILLRPFLFVIALVYYVALLLVGGCFGVMTLLDWLSEIVDDIRRYFFGVIRRNCLGAGSSFFGLVFNPIFAVLALPLLVASLAIPKLSGSVGDIGDLTVIDALSQQLGTFRQLASSYLAGVRAMFGYARHANLLLRPFAYLIAAVHALPFALCAAAVFLLIPLDWVSRVGEALRLYCLRISDALQAGIRHRFLGFIFNPALMLVLAPVLLLTVLVPKLSTNFDLSL